MRVKVRVKVPDVERRHLKITEDIRAEQSNPRTRLSPLTLNRALSTRQRTVFSWLPTFDKTLPEVLVWHWSNTFRLHQVYVPEYHKDETTAGYLRRLSCRVGIFATDADLRAIHLHDRPAFEMISGLERKMNVTMRQGVSLVQIVEAHSSTRPEDAQQ
jgi:DNA sulfur modification protein DndC